MQALPGFRDFLPQDCGRRNYVFSAWREVGRRYGFVEWDGPVLEPTELYKKKSGPEIVGNGREPSESPAFRVAHEIGASGKRPTIPDGNGSAARISFDAPMNHGQRAFVKERAM